MLCLGLLLLLLLLLREICNRHCLQLLLSRQGRQLGRLLKEQLLLLRRAVRQRRKKWGLLAQGQCSLSCRSLRSCLCCSPKHGLQLQRQRILLRPACIAQWRHESSRTCRCRLERRQTGQLHAGQWGQLKLLRRPHDAQVHNTAVLCPALQDQRVTCVKAQGNIKTSTDGFSSAS